MISYKKTYNRRWLIEMKEEKTTLKLHYWKKKNYNDSRKYNNKDNWNESYGIQYFIKIVTVSVLFCVR